MDLYAEMRAFSKKLRTKPDKETDLARVDGLIQKMEQSAPPGAASENIDLMQGARADIDNELFGKAAATIGTISNLLKGGYAGILRR